VCGVSQKNILQMPAQLAICLNRVCRIARVLPIIVMSLECGSLLPPWSRYKGASKLAHSKDSTIIETDADSHDMEQPTMLLELMKK
jgi:hypothetical protein